MLAITLVKMRNIVLAEIVSVTFLIAIYATLTLPHVAFDIHLMAYAN